MAASLRGQAAASSISSRQQQQQQQQPQQQLPSNSANQLQVNRGPASLMRGNSVVTLNDQIYQHHNSIPVRNRILHTAKSLQQQSVDMPSYFVEMGKLAEAQHSANGSSSNMTNPPQAQAQAQAKQQLDISKFCADSRQQQQQQHQTNIMVISPSSSNQRHRHKQQQQPSLQQYATGAASDQPYLSQAQQNTINNQLSSSPPVRIINVARRHHRRAQLPESSYHAYSPAAQQHQLMTSENYNPMHALLAPQAALASAATATKTTTTSAATTTATATATTASATTTSSPFQAALMINKRKQSDTSSLQVAYQMQQGNWPALQRPAASDSSSSSSSCSSSAGPSPSHPPLAPAQHHQQQQQEQQIAPRLHSRSGSPLHQQQQQQQHQQQQQPSGLQAQSPSAANLASARSSSPIRRRVLPAEPAANAAGFARQPSATSIQTGSNEQQPQQQQQSERANSSVKRHRQLPKIPTAGQQAAAATLPGWAQIQPLSASQRGNNSSSSSSASSSGNAPSTSALANLAHRPPPLVPRTLPEARALSGEQLRVSSYPAVESNASGQPPVSPTVFASQQQHHSASSQRPASWQRSLAASSASSRNSSLNESQQQQQHKSSPPFQPASKQAVAVSPPVLASRRSAFLSSSSNSSSTTNNANTSSLGSANSSCSKSPTQPASAATQTAVPSLQAEPRVYFTFDHTPSSLSSLAGQQQHHHHQTEPTKPHELTPTNNYQPQDPARVHEASQQQQQSSQASSNTTTTSTTSSGRRLSSCGLGLRANFLMNKQHAISDFTPPRSLESSHSRGSSETAAAPLLWPAASPSSGATNHHWPPPNGHSVSSSALIGALNEAQSQQTTRVPASALGQIMTRPPRHFRSVSNASASHHGPPQRAASASEAATVELVGGGGGTSATVSAGMQPRPDLTSSGCGLLDSSAGQQQQQQALTARSMLAAQTSGYCSSSSALAYAGHQQPSSSISGYTAQAAAAAAAAAAAHHHHHQQSAYVDQYNLIQSEQQQQPQICPAARRMPYSSALSVDVFQHSLHGGGGGGGGSGGSADSSYAGAPLSPLFNHSLSSTTNASQKHNNYLSAGMSSMQQRSSLTIPGQLPIPSGHHHQRDRQPSNVSTSSMPVGAFTPSVQQYSATIATNNHTLSTSTESGRGGHSRLGECLNTPTASGPILVESDSQQQPAQRLKFGAWAERIAATSNKNKHHRHRHHHSRNDPHLRARSASQLEPDYREESTSAGRQRIRLSADEANGKPLQRAMSAQRRRSSSTSALSSSASPNTTPTGPDSGSSNLEHSTSSASSSLSSPKPASFGFARKDEKKKKKIKTTKKKRGQQSERKKSASQDNEWQQAAADRGRRQSATQRALGKLSALASSKNYKLQQEQTRRKNELDEQLTLDDRLRMAEKSASKLFRRVGLSPQRQLSHGAQAADLILNGAAKQNQHKEQQANRTEDQSSNRTDDDLSLFLRAIEAQQGSGPGAEPGAAGLDEEPAVRQQELGRARSALGGVASFDRTAKALRRAITLRSLVRSLSRRSSSCELQPTTTSGDNQNKRHLASSSAGQRHLLSVASNEFLKQNKRRSAEFLSPTLGDGAEQANKNLQNNQHHEAPNKSIAITTTTTTTTTATNFNFSQPPSTQGVSVSGVKWRAARFFRRKASASALLTELRGDSNPPPARPPPPNDHNRKSISHEKENSNSSNNSDSINNHSKNNNNNKLGLESDDRRRSSRLVHLLAASPSSRSSDAPNLSPRDTNRNTEDAHQLVRMKSVITAVSRRLEPLRHMRSFGSSGARSNSSTDNNNNNNNHLDLAAASHH